MLTMNELKSKLTFIQNIKRVLESLKMIAAMNIKRYTAKHKISEMLSHQMNMDCLQKMLKSDATDILTIVITENSGLCGNFSIDLNRSVTEHIEVCQTASDIQYKWIVIGNKKPDPLKNIQLYQHMNIEKDLLKGLLSLSHLITELDQTLREIHIISWQCNSTQVQKHIITACCQTKAADWYNKLFSQIFALLNMNILSSLLKEERIRFFTMDQAINNADDMTQQLKNNLHQTRQGIITNELIEIITGAENL